MKQETLEEAAKVFFRKFKHTHSPDNYYLALVEFAKWKKERMYSEEDMEKYADYCATHVLKAEIGNPYLSVKEWLKQFKKK